MPKTRSGRTSRPSVEDEDDDEEEPLQTQLPTLEEHDDSRARPQAAKKPTPKPQQAVLEKKSTASKAKDAAEADEDDDRTTPAAKTSVNISVNEEFQSDHDDDDDGPTDAELAQLSLRYKDEMLYDVLDYELELILSDRASRKTHFPVFQYFWKNYPYRARKFGRLYARTLMCGVLVDACSEPAYAATSLVTWEKPEWQELVDDLEATKASCLRADRNVKMSYDSVENDTVITELSELPCFTKSYDIVRKACQLNLRIAEIRKKLEKQIATGGTGTPDLNAVKVAAILNEGKESDEFVIKKHILNLFKPVEGGAQVGDSDDDGEETIPEPQPILKNLEDLKAILSFRPFDLKWLQGKLEALMHDWNLQCFGGKQPIFMELCYHRAAKRRSTSNRLARQTTPQSRLGRARLRELSNLKRGRAALREDHGEDPLEMSRELAEQATGVPRAGSKKQRRGGGDEFPIVRRTRSTKNKDDDDEEEEEQPGKRSAKQGGRTLYEEKKTKSTINFEDSDEDEEAEDSDDKDFRRGRARLSNVPSRRESSGSAAQTTSNVIYHGPPPDEGIFNENGNVIHRHPWTDEEMDALVLGLEKFGVGKWVQIKNEYGHILRNRNSVQVKDKYRNMKKKGELPDEFLEDHVV